MSLDEFQWDVMVLSPSEAVLEAVKWNTDVQAQINWLENHRWKQTRLEAISDEEIIKACVSNGANIEAVKIALPFVAKATRYVYAEKIRTLTGVPAVPTLRTISALLKIQYSWRGINPRRPKMPRRCEKKSDSRYIAQEYEEVKVPLVAKLSEISDSEIVLAAKENKTTPAAIKAILPIVQEAFKNPRVITRKEIREVTGEDAFFVMKALSNLLGIPYSLRGFNPGRIFMKNMGSKGKPTYLGNEHQKKLAKDKE